MYLLVSFSDKALRVVLNTRDDHLELLQLDLFLLTRQATTISALMASSFREQLGIKVQQQHLDWDTVMEKELQTPVCPVEGPCALEALIQIGFVGCLFLSPLPSLLAQELVCLCHCGQGLALSVAAQAGARGLANPLSWHETHRPGSHQVGFYRFQVKSIQT